MTKIGDAAEALARAQALHERVHQLTTLAVTKVFGQADDDRVPFLGVLEDARIIHRAELNALTHAVLTLLGEEGKVIYLGYLIEELDLELKALEEQIGVTGYDGEGNPVLGKEQ